jgi:hypothetical protein
VDTGVGVGLAPGAETEAVVPLLPTLPHPVKIKTDEIKTQHTNLGPMGNDLLHTVALDAAELLDVGLARRPLPMNLQVRKPAHCKGRLGFIGHALLLEEV